MTDLEKQGRIIKNIGDSYTRTRKNEEYFIKQIQSEIKHGNNINSINYCVLLYAEQIKEEEKYREEMEKLL